MQSTTLQEKMAGNLRDSNLSFQAAEVGLRFCENILTQDYQFQVAALNLGAINTPPQARPLDQTWQIDNPATPVVEGPAAVSYTHLDVYKRQLEYVDGGTLAHAFAGRRDL